MASAEVRFYYIREYPYQVIYLTKTYILTDCKEGSSRISVPKHLNSLLEGELYLSLELSGLEFKNVGMQVFASHNCEGEPLLCYLATDVNLRCTLIDYERTPTVHSWSATPISYLLPFKELCILFIETYFAVCTESEHFLVNMCKHSLRFVFKEINPQQLKLEASVNVTYKPAPLNHVIVEVRYPYSIRVCFVKRSAWINKQVKSDDILCQKNLR